MFRLGCDHGDHIWGGLLPLLSTLPHFSYYARLKRIPAFKYSPKRMLAFHDALQEFADSLAALQSRRKLMGQCEPTIFCSHSKNAFVVVVDPLQNIEEIGAVKARQIKYSILKFDFLVVLWWF